MNHERTLQLLIAAGMVGIAGAVALAVLLGPGPVTWPEAVLGGVVAVALALGAMVLASDREQPAPPDP